MDVFSCSGPYQLNKDVEFCTVVWDFAIVMSI